jgi:hypothetical protein
MNILSGKEIMRPHTHTKKISSNEKTEVATDIANEARQQALQLKAENAKMGGKLLEYSRIIEEMGTIPRMVDDPETLGTNVVSTQWRAEPKTIKQSHFNGYNIYGVARMIMTAIYSAVGYDAFVVTETDSLAIPVSSLERLRSLKSVFGDPLVYANAEMNFGMVSCFERCTKAKQFGQLEIETTEKIEEVMKKRLGLKAIKSIGWKESELIVNGEPTGYFGPYMAVGGKKIYVQYLKHGDEIIPLKERFKGISFGRDIVVSIKESLQMKTMSREDRLKYAMCNLWDTGCHRFSTSDVFDYINKGRIDVVQYRVSEADVNQLTTRCNIVVKELIVRRREVLSERELEEIGRETDDVKRISLRALRRTLIESKECKCAWCDNAATTDDGYNMLCPVHEDAVKIDCGVCNNSSSTSRCRLHTRTSKLEILPMTNESCLVCGRLCGVKALACKLKLCPEHYSNRNAAVPDRPCRFNYGCKRSCKNNSCSASIAVGYMLCKRHYQAMFRLDAGVASGTTRDISPKLIELTRVSAKI